MHFYLLLLSNLIAITSIILSVRLYYLRWQEMYSQKTNDAFLHLASNRELFEGVLKDLKVDTSDEDYVKQLMYYEYLLNVRWLQNREDAKKLLPNKHKILKSKINKKTKSFDRRIEEAYKYARKLHRKGKLINKDSQSFMAFKNPDFQKAWKEVLSYLWLETSTNTVIVNVLIEERE